MLVFTDKCPSDTAHITKGRAWEKEELSVEDQIWEKSKEPDGTWWNATAGPEGAGGVRVKPQTILLESHGSPVKIPMTGKGEAQF